MATAGLEDGSPEPAVVSVTEDGKSGPAVARRDAHRPPGVLHRAVSVQLFDPGAGWLLQRRAVAKAAFASCWSNTCCTHPEPGEAPAVAGVRRLREELGLDVTVEALVPAGVFTYRAEDRASGLVEHEFDHVFVATVDTSGATGVVDEISQLARLSYADAMELLSSPSGTPWAAEVLWRSAAALDRW